MARAKKIEEVKKLEAKEVTVKVTETIEPVILKEDVIEEIQDIASEEEVKTDGPVKLKWKKIGGGSLRGIPNYPIIKPGQTFEAYLSDISPMFLKSLQCLDADLLASQIGIMNKPAPKENTWKVESKKVTVDKKSVIIWNVINRHTDKPINIKPLATSEEAETLCKALNN
jgi:hypothetical protein